MILLIIIYIRTVVGGSFEKRKKVLNLIIFKFNGLCKEMFVRLMKNFKIF